MADFPLLAQTLTGQHAFEGDLRAELAAAQMEDETFFGPEHEQTEGMDLLNAVEQTASANGAPMPEEVSSRVRALLGRAQEIVNRADKRDQLIAHLRYRLKDDGLPDVTDQELVGLQAAMRVLHNTEIDTTQEPWEPPLAVLDYDPRKAGGDTGPAIAPAPTPPPHEVRRIMRQMRKRDEREGRGRDTAGDARRPAVTSTGTHGPAGGGDRPRNDDRTQGPTRTERREAARVRRTDATRGPDDAADRNATTRTETATSTLGGGGGPNQATATVTIYFDKEAPAPPPPPPNVDVGAIVQAVVNAGQEQVRGMRDAFDHVLAEQARLAQEAAQREAASRHHGLRDWFLNIGLGNILVALLVLTLLCLGGYWALHKIATPETPRPAATTLGSPSGTAPVH